MTAQSEPLLSPVLRLQFHAGQLWSWREGVQEQFKRMLAANEELKGYMDGDRELPVPTQRSLHNDSQLLILAAWLGRLAAKDCANCLRELKKKPEADQVDSAIHEFDEALPFLKVLRHRIEHIDEYLQGEGHGKLPRPADIGWVGHADGDLIYEVAGIMFHIETIVHEIRQLADAVEVALASASIPKSGSL